MSKEYPCVYHDHGKCQKFSDDQYNAWCVNGPCEDQVMSNADHIRSMTDEELVDFANVQIGCGADFFPCGSVCSGKCESYDDKTCREKILAWLKQPYKEN